MKRPRKSNVDKYFESTTDFAAKIDEAMTPNYLKVARLEAEMTVASTLVHQLGKLPQLTDLQRRIGYYLSKGTLTYGDVAALTNCSKHYVRDLARDERMKQFVRLIQSGAINEVVEKLGAQEILNNAALRAAERVIEIMENSKDETSLKAALSVLDSTGHGSKKETVRPTIIISEEVARLYLDSKKEAGIEEAEYEVLPPSPSHDQ